MRQMRKSPAALEHKGENTLGVWNWLLPQQQDLDLVLLGSSCKGFRTEKPNCSRNGSEFHSPQRVRRPNSAVKGSPEMQHIAFAFAVGTC